MKTILNSLLSLRLLALYTLLGILILSSCNTSKKCLHYTGKVNQYCGVVPDKDSISYVEKETIKFDTTYLVDSAYMKMYLACDSNGNVLISQLTSYKGKMFKTKIEYRDNIIEVSAKFDSLAIINTYKESHKEEFKQNLKTVFVPKEIPVNHVPKIMWYLYIVAAAIGGFIVWKIKGRLFK